MKVTRHFGKPERVDIETLEIPDMWHLAMFIKENEAEIWARVGHNHIALQGMNKWSEAILETWNIAHDLKRNIVEGLINED